MEVVLIALASLNVAELIFVNVVCVFTISVLCKSSRTRGSFLRLSINVRICAAHMISTSINRDDNTSTTFDDVILAKVKVREAKPSILDFCRSNKVVFLQNRKVFGIPVTTIFSNCRVPNWSSIGIRNLRVINDTMLTIWMLNVFCSIQIVDSTINNSVAVAFARLDLRAVCSTTIDITNGIEVNLAQRDFTDNTVILEDVILIICGMVLVFICALL